MDGVEVSVVACFINSCQCQPMHPSLVLEGQSRVNHSGCDVTFMLYPQDDVCISQCALFAVCHPHYLFLDRGVCEIVTGSLVNVFDTE